MARIEKHVARKQKTCSKCHQTIEVGQKYLCGTPYRKPTVYRCLSCGLEPWELSNSAYIKNIGNLVENWEKFYPIDVSDGEFINSIVYDLESVKDECQNSLDNMPDNLRESSPTSETLQDRMDAIDEAIYSLCDIDFQSMEEEAKSEAEGCMDEPDRDGYSSDEEYEEAKKNYDEEVEESWKNAMEDNLRSAIEEALSNLEY